MVLLLASRFLIALKSIEHEVEGGENDEGTEHEGNNAELHIVGVGVRGALVNEGDARGVLAGLAEVFGNTSEDDRATNQEEGALEEKAVLLIGDVGLGGFAIAEEGEAAKKSSDKEDESGNAHVTENESFVRDIARTIEDQVADTEEDADGKGADG